MGVGQHAVAARLTAPPEPWRQRWSGWSCIPDASGQIRAATIADGSPSRGGWVTAPAGKPPAVVVARFDGSLLWGSRQALIQSPLPTDFASCVGRGLSLVVLCA